MQPLISIVIPTYNRSHLLGKTLDSIIAQTYINWECIIIDDGSKDYTHELMECYRISNPRILYFKRPENRLKGANACRNYGFEISKGDYINWFDDDDIMHPEKLEKQIKSLENSKYNFSVCQAVVFESEINNILGLRNSFMTSEHVFHDYLTMKIVWMTPSALWVKDFLVRNKFKYDEDLKAAQEWEFHLRILNKFPDYVVLNEALVFLRRHEQSVTYKEGEKRRFWYYFQARLKIYQNPEIYLGLESEKFLKEYLLNSFKKMIITKNPNILSAFQSFIIADKGISSYAKLNALVATIAFKFFNKGNAVLQKIKFR